MQAINSRKSWTTEDLQMMFRSYMMGISVKRIAKMLGRSTAAVYAQMNIADFTSDETNDTRSHTTFKNHKRNIKAAMSCNETNKIRGIKSE